MQPDILTYRVFDIISLDFVMGRGKIKNKRFGLSPKMVKPPPIKAILWSPVKSEKSQKLTKMSFLDFYQYLGLFSMDGTHVPLWERDSACARAILPVEQVFCLWKRDSPCGGEILPVEEMYCCGREILPVEEVYPPGRDLSLWMGSIQMKMKMKMKNME